MIPKCMKMGSRPQETHSIVQEHVIHYCGSSLFKERGSYKNQEKGKQTLQKMHARG